jgi:hypothetical protein
MRVDVGHRLGNGDHRGIIVEALLYLTKRVGVAALLAVFDN